jgi:hypothetical protein
VKIIEMDPSGNPQRQYERVEDFIFTPDGKRQSRLVSEPVFPYDTFC